MKQLDRVTAIHGHKLTVSTFIDADGLLRVEVFGAGKSAPIASAAITADYSAYQTREVLAGAYAGRARGPGRAPRRAVDLARFDSIDRAKSAGRGILERHSTARGFAVSTIGAGDGLRLEWTETRHGATFDASTLSPRTATRRK